MNQKGGVGKTTTILNLSAAMKRDGGNPIMIDMDPQAHLSSIKFPIDLPNDEKTLWNFYENKKPLSELITEWENVGRLISSDKELLKVETKFGIGPSIVFRLRDGLNELESVQEDANIFIDCPPSVGVLTLNAIFATDLVIIPISSDFLSINGAKKIEQTLKALEGVIKKRVNRRYLLTKYDKRRLMSSQVFNIAKTYFGDDLCDIVIHENVELAKSPHANQDIYSFNSKSVGAANYTELYHYLIDEKIISKN
jgi:chromosome partitioning protein